MKKLAQIAIYAAKHRRAWGNYAAKMYALRRGVLPSTYRVACQCEATKGWLEIR